MSDQVYDDPRPKQSHQADIDAGHDDDRGDDRDDDTAPGRVFGIDADSETVPDSSHGADVEAGYDDRTSGADSSRP